METATNVGEGYTYNSSTIVRVALAAGIIVLGVCALLLFMKVSPGCRRQRAGDGRAGETPKAKGRVRGGPVLPAPGITSSPGLLSLATTSPSPAPRSLAPLARSLTSFGAEPRSPGGCATANA
jgi:hypothetical protein